MNSFKCVMRRRLERGGMRLIVGALVVGFVSAGLVSIAGPARAATDPCLAPINVIACENSKPGSPSSVWDIQGSGDATIQGFGTDISVNVGSTINFKIKTDATAYTVDIYRTGYYGGDGARKIATVLPSVALPQAQPACLTDPTLIFDCGNWAVSAAWAVPSTAVSGVYIAKLTRTDTGGASHIPFIVRNEASTSNMVFQTSDTTWQAYNLYGGANFYPTGANGRAYKVSYNRPFDTRGSSPYGQDYYFSMEYPLVRFLEKNGYDVSYLSGVDVARKGALVKNHNVFLSVGHDEYWSKEQRSAVESARDSGVNLAFLSGNEVYWKTRWEKSLDASQTDWRTIVCYKETWAGAKIDPSPEWTGTWRDPRFSPPSDGGKPENALTGTAYMVNDDDFALQVPAADGKLRFWRNTSVAALAPGQVATLAPSTVGYESNEDLDNGFRPAGLMRLSTTSGAVPSYLLDYGATTGPGTTTHHLTLYRAPSGALVFSAGSIQFTWGLDSEHDAPAFPTAPADPAMQQAVVNLFADMGAQPTTLQAGLVAATKSTDTTPPVTTVTSPAAGSSLQNGMQVTVTGTSTDVGGVVGGVEVSLDNGATWHPASGRGTWTYTGSVGGIGASAIKARAVDDSGNLQAPTSVPVNLTCPCTLFPSSATPATVTNADTSGIELGMKFTSDIDGWVSGVRFYKGPSNAGTHVGSLWTAAGVRLGQVTFTSETASGWQTASFASPIEISAATTYVVSYHAPVGGYSSNSNYFSLDRDNAPLHAVKDGAQGPNGLFRYSAAAGAFPTSSFQATNYWVDAVFTTNGPADTTPPSVLATLPVSGQTIVDPAAPLKVAFSETMQQSSVAWSVSSSSGPVAGTSAYENVGKTATFTPSAPLSANRTYSVTLNAKDRVGNPLPTRTWSFTTWTAPPSGGDCPCSILAEAVPTTPSVNDPVELELGVKFRAATDGFVNGVSFYKGAGNSGPHTVTLWTGSGTAIATTQAYFESASGWQDVYFSAPVPVSANTTYVASYHTVVGFYSATAGQFANDLTNGPLTAPASGTVGGNGVYAYGPTTFPTNSFGATSYGVDVIFTAPPDTSAPTVVVAQPGAGASSVRTGVTPRVTFSEAVAEGSVSMALAGPTGPVAGTVSLDAARKLATFAPAASLSAATRYTLTVTGARDAAGNTMASFVATFTTSGAAACPCSVFASDALPSTPATTDSTPVELGMRFTASSNGWVTGVRFYKGSGNSGLHEGRLWTSGGALLSSLTFTGETATGWQQADFAVPVPVTAGTTYVVSYWAPQGRYASDAGFFASDYVNEPLTALAANGVFSTSQGGFPTTSFGATNYWVDAVFTTTAPPDVVPPVAVSSSPPAGATSVPPSSTLAVTFGESIRSTGVTMTVAPSSGPVVPGTVSVSATTNTVTFAPTALLVAATRYTVSVSGVTDTAGNVQSAPYTFSFTTAAATSATCPCSIWSDATAPTVGASSDPSEVEVGTKFRTDVNGYVTGVRFYKGVGNGGTHTGRLWSSTGTLLATATFVGESTAGWQTATFTPAVAVTANTTYVVSYHAPVGRYAADIGYFGGVGVDNGVLHALRSGVDGVNGVFAYGPASFPTQGTATNYWVDPVFDRTVDVSPPTVTAFSPPAGATNVASSVTPSATFSEAVSAASVVLTVRETVSGTVVTGATAFDAGTNRATFTPAAALRSDTGYTISASATDRAGNAMATPATAAFTTSDTVSPVVSAVAASGSGTSATVTWTTDEPGTSVVAYGASATALTSSVTGTPGVTAHSVTLNGLLPNTRYYYRVTTVDSAGNSTTSPTTSSAAAEYVPTVAPVTQSTFAQLSAGTNSGTAVVNGVGGEVQLAATNGNEFEGTAVGSGWSSTAVATGGTTSVAGGTATPDGAYLRTSTTYGASQTVEFSATLGAAANRLAGFGTTFSGSSMAAFSTGAGNQLQAVTRTAAGVTTSTTLSAGLATARHVYRIERSSSSITFQIDGVTVATRSLALTDSWAAGARDGSLGGGGPVVDWIRVLPYRSSGTYTGPVVDGLAEVRWGAISWDAALNGGTVTVQTRTGSIAVPDSTWSAWTTRTSGTSLGTQSRYVQYRVSLTTPATTGTPVVRSVTIGYAVR